MTPIEAVRAILLAGIIILSVAICACAAAPSPASPKEYLDQATAATVSVVGRPLVFARERRELAAYSRDYITIAAAAVDRMGKVEHVLIAYYWSTVDRRYSSSGPSVADPLVIVADDRRIQFSLQGYSAEQAGIGKPVHAPPGRDAHPTVYRTDLDTLRFLAAARHLVVLKDPEDASTVYELWDDERPALGALVRLLNGESDGWSVR
jgi:hypothetical protein